MAAPPLASKNLETVVTRLTSSCEYDKERWRQLERRLATFEEALIRQSKPPEKFLLNTEGGVLLWSLVASIIMLFFHNVFRILGKLGAAWKALQIIYTNRASSKESAASQADIDLNEVAMALAGERKRKDMLDDIELGLREEVSSRKWIAEEWERTDTLPHPTSCDVLSVANESSSSTVMGSATTLPSSEDTVNRKISVILHLLYRTLESDKEKEHFLERASAYLPPHSQDLKLEKGSTFLSARVSISSSTVQQLLDHATCLVKMGLSYDSVSTVQFGNTAVLYGTTETGKCLVNCF